MNNRKPYTLPLLMSALGLAARPRSAREAIAILDDSPGAPFRNQYVDLKESQNQGDNERMEKARLKRERKAQQKLLRKL